MCMLWKLRRSERNFDSGGVEVKISYILGNLVTDFGRLCSGFLKKQICYGMIISLRGDHLKITINIDNTLNDTEIVVSCKALTPETEQMISALRLIDKQLTVTKGDESYILDVAKVFYIESVDRKTFVYTSVDCFESRSRLYEIEDRLRNCGFQRVGKACLVNLKYIRSLKAEINRKLRLTLENGEQIIVSRQYADELKVRLGVK